MGANFYVVAANSFFFFKEKKLLGDGVINSGTLYSF